MGPHFFDAGIGHILVTRHYKSTQQCIAAHSCPKLCPPMRTLGCHTLSCNQSACTVCGVRIDIGNSLCHACVCACLVFIDFVSRVIAFAREVGALTKIERKKIERKCHVLLSKVKCMGHDTAERATPMQYVLRVVYVHVCVARRDVCVGVAHAKHKPQQFSMCVCACACGKREKK